MTNIDEQLESTVIPSRSFIVPAKAVKALSLFMGNDPTREPICGIQFDHLGDILLGIATDGRALLILHFDPMPEFKGQTLFISRKMAEWVRVTSKEPADVIFTWHPFSEISTAKQGDFMHTEVGVSQSFANWRQVLPDSPAVPIDGLCINGEYLQKFTQANRILTGKTSLVIWGHRAPVARKKDTAQHGPNCLSVLLDAEAWAYGVLMPMRFEKFETFQPRSYPLS